MLYYLSDFVFSFAWARRSKYLLIDDDPVYCQIMTKVAADLSIDLVTCTDSHGLAKIENLLQSGNFDIAILDYNFSIGTGIEIAEYLATKQQSLPCVLVSTNSLSHIKQKRLPRNIRAMSNKNIGAVEVIRMASRFAQAS